MPLAISKSNGELIIRIRFKGYRGFALAADLCLLLARLAALAIAIFGSQIMFAGYQSQNSVAEDLPHGALCFLAAAALWIFAEWRWNAQSPRAWWMGLDPAGKRLFLARIGPFFLWGIALLIAMHALTAESGAAVLLLWAFICFAAGLVASLFITSFFRAPKPVSEIALAAAPPILSVPLRPGTKSALLKRGLWGAAAILASLLVWQNSSGNVLPRPYFELWFASAALWALALAPSKWSPADWATAKIDQLRRLQRAERLWVAVAFVCILAFGAAFRLAHLDQVPKDMINNDHAADLLGANDIAQGEFLIVYFTFQAQETIHLYLTALFAALPGLDLDFFTLKLVSVVESLLTLPLLFWLGIEMMGAKRRKQGIVLGLLLMGMVAASYWHVAITRFAGRTHLTTFFATLTLIFLVRALRRNQRGDYIILGWSLGFGMYGYAACRMLPFVVVAGIGLALLTQPHTMRERFQRALNLGLTAWVAFMIYLPMFHVSLEYSEQFYRMLNEPVFGILPGQPFIVDWDAFFTGLMANFRKALLMFHWEGDHLSHWSVAYKPVLDVFTGGCLIVGVAAWGLRVMRHPRDAAWWLLPIMILIMMLPSTLSVADYVMVPSNTRVSGAIPPIYLLAALPVVQIAFTFARAIPRRLGQGLALGFCATLLLLALHRNTALYFDFYFRHCILPPPSLVGETMRAVQASGTPTSNIFLIPPQSAPYINSYAVFIEAGHTPGYTNDVSVPNLPAQLISASQNDGDKRLDLSRDLVFFYFPHDENTAGLLSYYFPHGSSMLLNGDSRGCGEGSVAMFRAPAIDEAGLLALMTLQEGA